MTQLKSRKDLVYAFAALSLIASLNGSTADAKYVAHSSFVCMSVLLNLTPSSLL